MPRWRCRTFGLDDEPGARDAVSVYLNLPSTGHSRPNTMGETMKVLLTFRAVAMAFSLGVGSAYASDGQSARPPFALDQDQPRSASARAPQMRPLFTIGRVGIHVWAPVPPPYNAEANGDLAARYLRGAG